jgi:hypothetical protein
MLPFSNLNYRQNKKILIRKPHDFYTKATNRVNPERFREWVKVRHRVFSFPPSVHHQRAVIAS